MPAGCLPCRDGAQIGLQTGGRKFVGYCHCGSPLVSCAQPQENVVNPEQPERLVVPFGSQANKPIDRCRS
jgi:hypothetical protein